MRSKRALIVVGKRYGLSRTGIEPLYYEWYLTLTEMGWEVDHFDHFAAGDAYGLEGGGSRFVDRSLTQDYDLILYQTAGKDRLSREALREVSQKRSLVAWNSDDDWQWDDYTSRLAPCFTYMVTTYRHVYERGIKSHSNLLLSQWGCLPAFSDYCSEKRFDFSFVGALYGSRLELCRSLSNRAGLECFGPGSGLVRFQLPRLRGIHRIPSIYGRALDFPEVNEVWNCSKLSFAPLGASSDPRMLQIKSRVFEMGLSGTVMVCEKNPLLDEFYEDGVDYVSYVSLDELVSRVRYLVKKEDERSKIAESYRRRTLACHLWSHRIQELLKKVGNT